MLFDGLAVFIVACGLLSVLYSWVHRPPRRTRPRHQYTRVSFPPVEKDIESEEVAAEFELINAAK